MKINKELVNIQKKDINKIIHIAIIIVGSIFIALSCFHTCLWFDESYSIAIANHSFVDIWKIGSYDVHPILYYWMIHIVMILTNNNIIFVRLFSCVPLILMSILGYTHIKKDFDEKTGILFSFLALFMPVCLVYSGEIRMYTWAMFFVTVMCIYAYRIYKSNLEKNNIVVSSKNWVIFSICSLASAYTHYYGLLIAAIVNITLLVFFIVNKIKRCHRKNANKIANDSEKLKDDVSNNADKNLKYNIISAIAQILLYLPWLRALLAQTSTVSKGYWIQKIDSLKILKFQFTGILNPATQNIPDWLAWTFIIVMLAYLVFLLWKNRKNCKPVLFAIYVYVCLILVVCLIDKILNQKILYERYFLNITGLVIFVYAFLMGKDNNKIRLISICSIIVIVSTVTNINMIKTNYDSSNSEPFDYISSRISTDDIIITDNNDVTNFGGGFVLIAKLEKVNSNIYFWNISNWHNVDEAYEAYGKTIYSVDMLKNNKGKKVWAVSDGSFALAENIVKQVDGAKIIEQKSYNTKYENYSYSISLIEL